MRGTMTEPADKPDNQGKDRAWVSDISQKMSAKAPQSICPFCNNTKWFIVGGEPGASMLMFANRTGLATYSFSCTNCGFVRQHLQHVVNGELTGEVVYAKSEG